MYWLQKIQIVLILAVILSEYFSLEKNIDGKKKENKEAECFQHYSRDFGPSFNCLHLQAHHLQEQARRNELRFTYCIELCSEIYMQKLTHSLVKLRAFQSKHSNIPNSEHIKLLVLIFTSVSSEWKNSAPFHPKFGVGFKIIYINKVHQWKISTLVCSHNIALLFPSVYLNLSNYFLKTISQNLCFSVNV